jgi:hypothetical protein
LEISEKKADCGACGQPYEKHSWGPYADGGEGWRDIGMCLSKGPWSRYYPKEERKPDASLAPQKVYCPNCGSDNTGPTIENGVGNTMDCFRCGTDFTPGIKRERPYSLFDK